MVLGVLFCMGKILNTSVWNPWILVTTQTKRCVSHYLPSCRRLSPCFLLTCHRKPSKRNNCRNSTNLWATVTSCGHWYINISNVAPYLLHLFNRKIFRFRFCSDLLWRSQELYLTPCKCIAYFTNSVFKVTHARYKLYLCSFTLFIVLNRSSQECHSDNKTGDRVNAADNDDDGDDVINGRGGKGAPVCSQARQIRPFFHTDSTIFCLSSVIPAIYLSSIFPFLIMFR